MNRTNKRLAILFLLIGSLLVWGNVDAGKKKKKQEQPAAPAAPSAQAAPAPTGPSAWETYETGVALVKDGQLVDGVAKLEEASSTMSDPIVWCYSRLYLADAYFQLGNATEDPATRDANFAEARDRFREASYCVGAELPAEGDPDRPTAEQIAVMAEFQTFGTEDLASQLESVAGNQGELLSGGEDHEAIEAHWRLVQEVSGPSRLTHYHIALACFEGSDLDCAATEVLESVDTPGLEPADPVGTIVGRAVERAVDGTGEEAARYWKFVFGVLADWHEQDPIDDRPSELLQETLTPLSEDERLQALGLADDCWVPLEFARGLRKREQPNLDEALIAYRCDPEGPAKNLLIDTYYERARDAWNSLTPMTAEAFNDPAKVRNHMREIEPALENLDKALEIEEYDRAVELKAKITSYVGQMRDQRTNLAEEAAAETATYCKQQWNSFRWWSDRRYEMLANTPSRAEYEEFRSSCKSFMESNGQGDDLVELGEDITEALMLQDCQKKWQKLKKDPDAETLRQFEAECEKYVDLYEVEEPLRQVKNSIGG
jgi:hypothetical protein